MIDLSLGQGLLWAASILLLLSWAASLLERLGRWPGGARPAAQWLKRASLVTLVAFGLWVLLFLAAFLREVAT